EVPQGISEYDWTGGIRGEPYEVVIDPITKLPIPARAEVVLVGFLHHDKKAPEGPFGEWTGYYASGEREEPTLEVEAIYHRDDPILLGVPPNKPPYEPHRYREYLRSALLLREVKAAGVPAIHPDQKGFSSRLVIDACKPWEWRERFPIAIGPDAETKRETRKKWGWILQQAVADAVREEAAAPAE